MFDRYEMREPRAGETLRLDIDWENQIVTAEYWVGDKVVWAYHPRKIISERTV